MAETLVSEVVPGSPVWTRNDSGSIALVTYNIGPAGTVSTAGSNYIIGSPHGVIPDATDQITGSPALLVYNIGPAGTVTTAGSSYIIGSPSGIIPNSTADYGSALFVTGSLNIKDVVEGSITSMPTTTVTATDFDIRDLNPGQDSVNTASILSQLPAGTNLLGSVVAFLPNAWTGVGSITGTLSATTDYDPVAGSPTTTPPASGLFVVGKDSGTGSLVSPTFSSGSLLTKDNTVWIGQGSTLSAQDGTWNVGLNAGTNLVGSVVAHHPGTITVTSTDLDIRDLTSASDSVAAVQSGVWNTSSLLSSLPAGTNLIGSVIASIPQTVTTNVTNVTGSPTITPPASGLFTLGVDSATGSLTSPLFKGGSLIVFSNVGTGGASAGSNYIVGSPGGIKADVTSAYGSALFVTGSLNIKDTANVIGSIAVTNQIKSWTGQGSVLSSQTGVWNTSSILSALPAGNKILGSVIVKDGLKDFVQNQTSAKRTLDWTGTLTGSIMASGLTALTGIIAAASSATLITLFDGTNSTANRIAKVPMIAEGGFIKDYSKPLTLSSGSVGVTTVGGVGYVTVEGY